MKLFCFLLLASVFPGQAFAQDVYNPATNELSIPSVNVGNRIYTNVVITVGDLISAGDFYELEADSFSLNEAYRNYIGTSATRRFSISGNLFGSAVTGDGTETTGRLNETSFLNAPAYSKTTNLTMTVHLDNKQTTLSLSATAYLDAQNRVLGMVLPEEMQVVGKYFGFAEQALPNDTGMLYESTVYEDSAMADSIGKVRATYSTTYESANSLVLQIITTRIDNSGQIESTASSVFRVGRDKTISPISETVTSSDGILTISY